jgi:hypothetical protein
MRVTRRRIQAQIHARFGLWAFSFFVFYLIN